MKEIILNLSFSQPRDLSAKVLSMESAEDIFKYLNEE